jgi:CarD family transcriptional regulator
MRKSKKSKLGAEDRNMLDSARQILVSEVAQVKGIDEKEAGNLLDQVIEQEEKIANL